MTEKIRKFCDTDIDQILTLQNEWFESDILPSYVKRLFKDEFTEENTYVVEKNDIIGYSWFKRHSSNEFEIEFLYLSKTQRKKGIGKKLINTVELEIKNRGGRKIILSPTTKIHPDKLINYYTELGYSQEKDRLFGDISHTIMSKLM